jgi:hypothetical protein
MRQGMMTAGLYRDAANAVKLYENCGAVARGLKIADGRLKMPRQSLFSICHLQSSIA